MKMGDQSVNKGKVKIIKKIRPKKYLIFFGLWRRAKTDEKREKKRGRRRRRRKIREKGLDFVWIFMGFYGLVWILV